MFDTLRSYFVVMVLVTFISGCNLDHPGEEPSEGELYFPVALALAPSENQQGTDAQEPEPSAYLYVVNSNFDLRYNAGSVQAYDLDALEKKVQECEEKSEKCRKKKVQCFSELVQCEEDCPNDDSDCLAKCSCTDICVDDPCAYSQHELVKDKVFKAEVLINSYATGAAFSPSGKRLYVPTRNNTAALTFIEVDESASKSGLLDCGQGNGRRCSDAYVRGKKSSESLRHLELTGEPIGLVVRDLNELIDENGSRSNDKGEDDYILVANRNGSVALFINDDDDGPSLVDIEESYPQALTDITFDPITGYAYLTSQPAGQVSGSRLDRILIQYIKDDSLMSQLHNPGNLSLGGFVAELSTRAVAFEPNLYPNKVFVLTRLPSTLSSALLVVDMPPNRGNTREALIQHIVEVGDGASRLTVGRIGDDPRLFAFVSCFNSRELYVIDIESGEPVSIVQGFSGPFELVLDSHRKLVYLADFRSSIVRIVDVSPVICTKDGEDINCDDVSRNSQNIPCECNRVTRVIATMGVPRPPEEII